MIKSGECLNFVLLDFFVLREMNVVDYVGVFVVLVGFGVDECVEVYK